MSALGKLQSFFPTGKNHKSNLLLMCPSQTEVDFKDATRQEQTRQTTYRPIKNLPD